MRLQEAEASALLAAGAAHDLMQKLEGALRRARIAVGEAEIGIDDPDQVEFWEVMALGDELGADDEIETPLRHVIEFGAQPLDRFHEIARQDQDAAPWKQLGGLVLKPLDARADGDETLGRLA